MEITLREPSDPSDHASEDIPRPELPWEAREEAHVQQLGDSCRAEGIKHRRAAARCRMMFRALAAPTISLPLCAGTYSSFVPCDENDYLLAILLLASALSASASSFLDYGRRQAQHDDYGARYEELAGDIDSTLCRPKRFRPPCDIVLEGIRLKFAGLKRGAPPII